MPYREQIGYLSYTPRYDTGPRVYNHGIAPT